MLRRDLILKRADGLKLKEKRRVRMRLVYGHRDYAADNRADITGPDDAEHGILYIYDVFSFRSHSLQGVGILAFSAFKPTLVVMVDWFNGGAVKEEWMTSDAGRNLMRRFVETTADPGTTLPAVIDVLSKLKADMYYPRVEKWGAVGFCWGGKLVSLLATQGEESPITVAAQSSPARLDPEEARTVTIPMAVLASSKEAGEALTLYEDNLQGVKHVEVFASQIHGWMSAR